MRFFHMSLQFVFLSIFIVSLAGNTSMAQAAEKVKVLCENRVYDGYDKSIILGENADDMNSGIKKIVRNCTFRNSNVPGIVVRAGRNILIEGNVFKNIRTRIPGDGVHAVYLPGRSGTIDNVTIANNTFSEIGADGIQMGDVAGDISNVYIRNNTFTGTKGIGENSVDVKAVVGPIVISGNTIRGYRPCLSPKQGGNQDCSGSLGAGLTVHDGKVGESRNVTVENNNIYNNTKGLTIATSSNHIVRNNKIHDNIEEGLEIHSVKNIRIEDNTISNNGRNVVMENVTNCTSSGNILSGKGGGSLSGCRP